MQRAVQYVQRPFLKSQMLLAACELQTVTTCRSTAVLLQLRLLHNVADTVPHDPNARTWTRQHRVSQQLEGSALHHAGTLLQPLYTQQRTFSSEPGRSADGGQTPQHGYAESIWTLSNGISLARLCSAPFLSWWLITEQWHLCLPGLVIAGAAQQAGRLPAGHMSCSNMMCCLMHSSSHMRVHHVCPQYCTQMRDSCITGTALS